MARMRLVLALGLVLSTTAAASTGPSYAVPCAEIIAHPRFPYAGYRLVLDAVSVPPAYVGQPVALHERPWAYWRKAGLVVRANERSVDVSVAPAWRGRAAVIWGNGGRSPAGSLRIAGCGGPRGTGNAYAGGFLLAMPSACVPIVFRTGGRSATVRFGIGRRCL